MKQGQFAVETTRHEEALLSDIDLAVILANQKRILRELDYDVRQLMVKERHKTRHMVTMRMKAMFLDNNLTNVQEILIDRLAQSHTRADGSAIIKQELVQACQELVTRHEKVKKNIADDLAHQKYLEGKQIDAVKILQTLIGFPIAAAGLLKLFVTGDLTALTEAAEVGLIVGAILTADQPVRNYLSNPTSSERRQALRSLQLQHIVDKNMRRRWSTSDRWSGPAIETTSSHENRRTRIEPTFSKPSQASKLVR